MKTKSEVLAELREHKAHAEKNYCNASVYRDAFNEAIALVEQMPDASMLPSPDSPLYVQISELEKERDEFKAKLEDMTNLADVRKVQRDARVEGAK